MKEKIERPNQILTKPISGCARLYQLLSVPPKKSVELNQGILFPQVIVGTSGIHVCPQPDMKTNTFNENSNQIIRALAACQMGLFAHPSDQDTYVAGPKDMTP